MLVDARFTVLKPVRSQLGMVLTPLYWLGDLPVRGWNNTLQMFSSRTDLLAENEQLRAETLLMQRRLQKLATLTEQNVRLRELLNSSALIDDRVLVAELIGVDPNPYTHRVLINKGSNSGVTLGQPVLDARGVMGQVIEVMPYSSRVLLITDSNHSVPVQVNRNGLRAIASGTGNLESIELRYVTDSADIREGDFVGYLGYGAALSCWLSSGCSDASAAQYRAAFCAGAGFAGGNLNRSRYLLLVFSDSKNATQALDDTVQNALDDAVQLLKATESTAAEAHE